MEARGLGARGIGEPDFLAPEQAVLGMGFWGGVVLIAAAVLWFVVGYLSGYIFFYPPVLALIGVYGVVRGLGTHKPPRRPSAARAKRTRARRESRR